MTLGFCFCAGCRFITGGTNAGIMKFVGEAHARYNPEAPLLGISSLGAVAGGPPLRKKAMCVSAGTDDGDHDDDALKYDDLVNSAPREQGDALLDPNHSHFLLVDNKQNGVEAICG